MKFDLTKKDKKLLSEAGIPFSDEVDYGDEEALEFLDAVYDREVFFAQAEEKTASSEKAAAYAHLADKIQAQIPEE